MNAKIIIPAVALEILHLAYCLDSVQREMH